jgi:hypothetical protein
MYDKWNTIIRLELKHHILKKSNIMHCFDQKQVIPLFKWTK